MVARTNSILGGKWTTQSKSTKLLNVLQVREAHLDLLAFTSQGSKPSVLMSDRATSRARS
jgi:hypothetical protein